MKVAVVKAKKGAAARMIGSFGRNDPFQTTGELVGGLFRAIGSVILREKMHLAHTLHERIQVRWAG